MSLIHSSCDIAHGTQLNQRVLQVAEARDVMYNVSSEVDNNVNDISQKEDYFKDTRPSVKPINRMERKGSHDDGVVLICCSVKGSTGSNTHVSEESCYLQDTEPHRIRNRILLSPTIATTSRAHSKVCHMYGRGSQYVCLVCWIRNESSHSSDKYCGSFSGFIAHLVGEVTKKREPFVHRTEKVPSFTTMAEKGGQQEEPHRGRPPELCVVIL